MSSSRRRNITSASTTERSSSNAVGKKGWSCCALCCVGMLLVAACAALATVGLLYALKSYAEHVVQALDTQGLFKTLNMDALNSEHIDIDEILKTWAENSNFEFHFEFRTSDERPHQRHREQHHGRDGAGAGDDGQRHSGSGRARDQGSLRSDYRLLGVSVGDDLPTIKKAYRTLASSLHPDKNPGCTDCEAKFIDVTNAYSRIRRQSKWA